MRWLTPGVLVFISPCSSTSRADSCVSFIQRPELAVTPSWGYSATNGYDRVAMAWHVGYVAALSGLVAAGGAAAPRTRPGPRSGDGGARGVDYGAVPGAGPVIGRRTWSLVTPSARTRLSRARLLQSLLDTDPTRSIVEYEAEHEPKVRRPRKAKIRTAIRDPRARPGVVPSGPRTSSGGVSNISAVPPHRSWRRVQAWTPSWPRELSGCNSPVCTGA